MILIPVRLVSHVHVAVEYGQSCNTQEARTVIVKVPMTHLSSKWSVEGWPINHLYQYPEHTKTHIPMLMLFQDIPAMYAT